MKKIFSFLTVLLLLVNVEANGEIYVFGDSLSDTGNLFAIAEYPPSPPYFEGRFSNGPVWVEYLATKLGLNYNQETNFAWGGALTGNSNIFSGAPGLKDQITQYVANTPMADPDALYFIWAGANDFFAADFTQTDPQTVITVAVTNILEAVGSLINHGAQHVVVLGLPDLGKIPDIRQLGIAVQLLFSNLTQGFNEGLVQNLPPQAIYIDILSHFNTIIDNPAQFDLENVIDACLDSSTQMLCDNPTTYLFWDGVHPTTRTNQIIANTVYRIIRPLPVKVTQFTATTDKAGIIWEWNIGVGAEIASFRLWGGIPKPNKNCSLNSEDYLDITSIIIDNQTNATLIKAINQNEKTGDNYRYYARTQSIMPCYALEVINFAGTSDLYVTQSQPHYH